MTISRYEIDNENSVRVWLHKIVENDAPVLYQPFSPQTKEPWASREEAEDFAKGICAGFEAVTEPLPEPTE